MQNEFLLATSSYVCYIKYRVRYVFVYHHSIEVDVSIPLITWYDEMQIKSVHFYEC